MIQHSNFEGLVPRSTVQYVGKDAWVLLVLRGRTKHVRRQTVEPMPVSTGSFLKSAPFSMQVLRAGTYLLFFSLNTAMKMEDVTLFFSMIN